MGIYLPENSSVILRLLYQKCVLFIKKYSLHHHLSRKIRLTVCPRSSYPFYIITYNIKWVTSSWTDGILTLRTRV